MVAGYIWQPMASNTYNNRCVFRTRIFIAAWFDFFGYNSIKIFSMQINYLTKLQTIYTSRIGLFSKIEVFKETKNNFCMGTQKCITGMFRKGNFLVLSSDWLGLSNPLSIAKKTKNYTQIYFWFAWTFLISYFLISSECQCLNTTIPALTPGWRGESL